MKKVITSLMVAGSLSVAALMSACATDKTSDGKSATKQYVDDAGITAEVKAAFAKDETVRALSISVETKNGVVQLSGFGRSELEKRRAEEIARKVNGVRQVKNDIVLKP